LLYSVHRYPPLPVLIFSLQSSAHPRDLHSFPTRRSSDLGPRAPLGQQLTYVPHAGRESLPLLRDVDQVAVLLQHRPAPCAEGVRSEEHTSELQSRGHLVCRLLLEKKKKNEQV